MGTPYASSDTPGPRLRVVVADGNQDARTLLRTALESSGQILVVGEATDGQAVIDLTRDLLPGGVVSDQAMPGLTGAEALRTLRQELPGTVLVLCTEASSTVDRVFDADAVVVKTGSDWCGGVSRFLIQAAQTIGVPPTWPRWERRGWPR